MKKLSTLILFTLLLTTTSYAQIQTALGFKGGVAFSKLNGKSINSSETNAGPTIGGFARLGFAQIVDFQIEMLYTQMGGKYKLDSASYNPSLSYLEFPLLLKIKIPISETVYPYAYIGESAGFKIGETTNKIESSDGTSKPVGDQFNGLNLSTVYGAGVDLESDFVTLSLDFRYSNGMINVFKTGEGQTGYFAMSVGFGFKLTKEEETAATN